MQKPNKITLKNRTLVFENSIYRVFSDEVSDDFGNYVEDYLSVESRYQTKKKVAGVCILPYDNSHVLMVSINRHPLNTSRFEVIKGHIDVDEPLVDAALRELSEESGLSCKAKDLTLSGIVAPEAGLLKGQTALFFAKVEQLTLNKHEVEFGHEGAHLFSFKEVLQLIENGKITDATSLVAIMRLQQQQNLSEI